MAAHEAYIKQHLSKYRHKALTKAALLSTIKTFPGLRPEEDTFVFHDLKKTSLLSLNGTIPVLYKGSSYNIPICIWFLESFPYSPPMCYVKPTQNMLIKPSRHVGSEGRVYLPYLHEWRHPNSDLIGLIQVMMVVFGESSPLFARGPSSSQDPFKPVEIKQSVFSKPQFLKVEESLAGSSISETKTTAAFNHPIFKEIPQSLNSNIFGVDEISLTDEEDMFNFFDTEKIGKLDHQNFKSCLLGLGYNLPIVEEGQQEPEFEAILDAVDPNRDGFVSLQVYMSFVSSQCEVEKALKTLTDKGKPFTKHELCPLIVKSGAPGGNSTNLEGNAEAKNPVLPADDYSTQIKTMEEQMKNKEASWENEREQMEKRIKELGGEVKNLQEQLEQMKRYSGRLEEESQAMKQKFESQTADHEAELHQTKHEKTFSQTKVERLQKELEEARKQLKIENGPGEGTTQGNSEDASSLSAGEAGNLSLEDFGKFQYHLSSYLTQDIIRDLTLVLAFSPTESEQAEQNKIKFIRLLREKGLISQADITPLTKALVTIGRHGVYDTVKKLSQSNPSEE